jgi:hydrogenase maturation protease
VTVLVGGVSQLYQADFDFGRVVVERLAGEELGDGVGVVRLDYGAVAVAQELEDLRPDALVLVGAAERGRRPGTLERRRIDPPALSPAQVRQAVAEAVTGYVGIDLVIEVASGLGALPRDAVAIELEPVLHGPGERLSPDAQAALGPALELVRAEVTRAGRGPADGPPPASPPRSRSAARRP